MQRHKKSGALFSAPDIPHRFDFGGQFSILFSVLNALSTIVGSQTGPPWTAFATPAPASESDFELRQLAVRYALANEFLIGQ